MSIAAQLTALSADKTAIANAITAKGGTLSQNNGFDTFAADIATIQTGGNIDALIDKSITSITSNAASVGYFAFADCTSLVSASFPSATSIAEGAFRNCTALTTVSFPSLTTIDYGAFDGCRDLANTSFPSVLSVGTLAFSTTRGLGSVYFPSVTYLGHLAFLGSGITQIALGYNGVVTLGSDKVFSATVFDEGEAGGTVYVPQALISSYRNAANWSALNCTFAAIEGSIYDDSN